MKFSAKRFLVLLTLITFPVLTNASLLAQRANGAGDEVVDNKQFYQATREDMEGSLGAIGQDYYVVYRIVERIARANGLDERPWRIRIIPKSNVNAYASQLNLLTFEGGLLEQIEGDRAALACVVGHEMAHHTEKHIPAQVAMSNQLKTLQKEALEQAREEVEAANRRGGIFGGLINIATGITGRSIRGNSWGSWAAGPVANQTLRGLNQEQTKQAMAKAEEIYEERVEELNDEYAKEMQQHELEADRVGYEYVVRAGFSPDGCNRMMAVLSQTETAQLPSISHPKPADRLADLKGLNTPTTNQKLEAEGEANLSESAKPLEYGLARDKGSIRIESRFGGRDIDSGFPE